MEGKLEESLLGPSSSDERRMSLGRKIWVESRKLWRVGGPSVITRLTLFGMFVVTQSFMGHIGDGELAAYALVQTVIMRFSNGILLGMGSALETFCGQAYGAGQHQMMGIYMQRSWIVLLVTATILIPVYTYTTEIFLSMGQEEEISRMAGPISLWFIPINYYYVFTYTLQMFLQAQLKNAVIAWVSTASFLLHILLSWVFVDVCKLGVDGAMGSMILSCWLAIIGQFIYVFGGWCPNTWTGFSWLAFRELWPVIKLSLASGVMICLELWYNSVLVLLAGYMPNAEVAINAFSICLNITAWELMISLGFLSAASVRVANELGRGDASAAKFAILTVSATSLFIGLVFFILFMALGGLISYAFTSNVEVAKEVDSLRIYLSLSVLLNSIQPVLSGVALGAGWQHIVAYVNIGSYYILGIPLGIVLGYVANLSIRGIWIGMICGIAIQTLVLIIITSKTDWNKQVEQASHRVKKWVVAKDEKGKNGTENTDMHHG
ncbi:protein DETOXIFICATION 20-like [Aristolochia californica]|uniref:protein DETOXIFICATION 20-like n=1 Tax=Aristolochia californica TaxID=171875 RepID=UPI0035E02509